MTYKLDYTDRLASFSLQVLPFQALSVLSHPVHAHHFASISGHVPVVFLHLAALFQHSAMFF